MWTFSFQYLIQQLPKTWNLEVVCCTQKSEIFCENKKRPEGFPSGNTASLTTFSAASVGKLIGFPIIFWFYWMKIHLIVLRDMLVIRCQLKGSRSLQSTVIWFSQTLQRSSLFVSKVANFDIIQMYLFKETSYLYKYRSLIHSRNIFSK